MRTDTVFVSLKGAASKTHDRECAQFKSVAINYPSIFQLSQSTLAFGALVLAKQGVLSQSEVELSTSKAAPLS